MAGDLYMYNPAYYGTGSGSGAVVRIDPGTGLKTVLVDLATSSSDQDQIAYDPWRDRVIFYGGFVPNHNEVYLSDAAGNVTSLGFAKVAGPTLGHFAPRGDGLIYFNGWNDPGHISYFDSADVVHTLMDATGTAPYTSTFYLGGMRQMEYYAATNSLVVASVSGFGTCTGGIADAANLRRLDLSADGTRVLSESCFQFDLKAGTGGEVPVGLGTGIGGDLHMTIDDNSNDTLPRMVRVDVAALSATAFAWNGHTFAASTMAGCFSQVLAKAVILDAGNDVLRAFADGEVGGGTIIATSTTSSPGSGEVATLIEIGPGGAHFGMTASPSSISIAAGGTQSWTMDFGAARAGLPYLVLGSVTGWTPATVVDGVAIPLVADFYTDFTLLHPNSVVLPGSFGLLDGAGRGSAALAFPAGGPAVVGLVAYHATIVTSFAGVVQVASNPVAVVFVP
ncbi:MAG: hypothetical protein P1V81_12610 [Planctomycetota bacterium]|nr:hypothetical protein [Planctomycetota bacterium]